MPTVLIFLVALFVLGAFVGWFRRRETAVLPAVTAEPEVAEPAATAVDDAELRLPVTVLIVGGLALTLIAYAVYSATGPARSPGVLALVVAGILSFLLGGRALVRREATLWQNAPVRRLAAFLQVTPAHLYLLALALPLAWLARLAAGDGLLARQPLTAVVAWLLAGTAAVLGALGSERVVWRSSRRDVALALFFFVAAFAARGTLLGQIPTTLSGDEGSAGLAAVRILEGEATNLFGVGWFSFPNFYFAVQSSGIALLGQTAEGLRATSAIAGALTVVALYWLGRVMFDRTTAVLAALYLTGAHYHIHFSRIGLQNIWDGLFLVVVLAAMWAGWGSGRRAPFVAAGVALGLGQYFYVSLRVLPLLLLVWAALALLVERERLRQRLPDLLLSAFVAAVVVLPLALFFLKFPNEFNAPLQRVSVLGEWLTREVELTGLPAWRIIAEQMSNTALGFTHLPLRHWYTPGVPLLLPAAAALFILGLLWLLYALDLRYLLIVLPLLAMIILGGLSQDAPASQRYVMAMPLAALLVALPLGQAARWLRPLWPGRRRWLTAAVLLLMGAVTSNDIRFYFQDVYDSYILGGYNTYTANEIAHYLRDEAAPGQDVYFAGLPRMGYFSFSTIPYLAPSMQGHDIVAPLEAPPAWPLRRSTLFIVLPERQGDLAHIRAAHPEGTERTFYGPDGPNGPPLFTVYAVTP